MTFYRNDFFTLLKLNLLIRHAASINVTKLSYVQFLQVTVMEA